MGYSDSNQAIQIIDPRKEGKAFEVGIYDNVASAFMEPRFVVKNGTLYMNSCADKGGGERLLHSHEQAPRD